MESTPASPRRGCAVQAFPNLPDSALSLPESGPAAHLSHKVLVSKESTKRSRHRNLGRSTQQFVLPSPTLSPSRLASLGRAQLKESHTTSLMVLLSARETRRDKKLQALTRERQAPPPPLELDDGERALKELQATGDPQFQLQASVDGTGWSPVADFVCDTPHPSPSEVWTSPRREASHLEEKTMRGRPQERQESLRRCFRYTAAEIQEAYSDAFKWNVLPELSAEPKVNGQAKALQTMWEESLLPPEIRASELLGSSPREGLETAADREISAAVSYLNLVRWLCGLPVVEISPSKQLACSILCQALLPRASKSAKPRTDEVKPKSLAALRYVLPSVQLAQELNELKNAVLILQGEASLVSALQDGFGAVHLCHPDEEGTDAGPLLRGPQEVHLSDVSSEWTRLSSGARAEEHPQALNHLKVLWQLDPACPVALKSARRARSKAIPRRFAEPPNQAKQFGLDAIWGDRKGFLTCRRSLLSPKLFQFGAARSDDNCVLWIGPEGCLESWGDIRANPGEATPLQASDIPAVCYPPPGLVPLAIMEGRNMPWTVIPDALRFQPTSSTTVRVFTVHIERCNEQLADAERLQEVRVKYMSVDCSGESFCVIFWPDLGHIEAGLQLEVQISGLRGDQEELFVFHEFMALRKDDQALVAEAESFRELLFQAEPLWNPLPKDPVSQRKELQIEPLSHLGREISVASNDLVLTLRSSAASIWGTLMVKRFDGEFTEVLRACHTIKLRDRIFLVRVKLPLPRHYYELKFSASSTEAPREVYPGLLRYFVHTSGKCPAIVRSLDDGMMEKYGFVNVKIEAQLHGITIITPCKFRVPVGEIYFLVHVDRGNALQAAHDDLPSMHLLGHLEETQDGRPRLFAQRLLPSEDFRSPKEVKMMHETLENGLSKNIQDAYGDIHLDLVFNNGHIQRLRERRDLPCLFEGFISIADIDISTKIHLVLRFPKLHACDFSPRRLAEWIVCRAQERLHENF